MPTSSPENHCPASTAGNNARPVIVLGMHKSGTTFLSKTLHQSGINMVDKTFDAAYDEGNKWERESLLKLNKEALQCGSKWSILVRSPISPDDAAWQNTAPQFSREIERLNREYARWGFKDPRTCMTYEGWKTLLPEHELLCVIRHPHAIWPRYKRQGQAKGGFIKKLIICSRYLKCYAAYMRAIAAAVDTHPRALIFAYDQLMESDGWMNQLKNQLDLDQVADVRTRNNVDELSPDIYVKCCELWEKLTTGTTCSGLYQKLLAYCIHG